MVDDARASLLATLAADRERRQQLDTAPDSAAKRKQDRDALIERLRTGRAAEKAGTGAVAKCMRDQRMSTARTPARLATSNRILQLSSRAAPLPRARASDQQ